MCLHQPRESYGESQWSRPHNEQISKQTTHAECTHAEPVVTGERRVEARQNLRRRCHQAWRQWPPSLCRAACRGCVCNCIEHGVQQLRKRCLISERNGRRSAWSTSRRSGRAARATAGAGGGDGSATGQPAWRESELHADFSCVSFYPLGRSPLPGYTWGARVLRSTQLYTTVNIVNPGQLTAIW